MLVFVLCFCTAAVAFADDLDYSQWDSHAGYPSDVLNTKLFTSVKFLMDRKIFSGDSDGLFHPNKNISRAEFATIIARATNNANDLESVVKEELFTDLEGHWAKAYINAASKAGLVNGVGDGKFAPDANVTYAEVITVLIRMNEGATSTAEVMAATWPDNYIAYAETYNMKGNVVIYDWNAPATKGDVSELLYRRIPK